MLIISTNDAPTPGAYSQAVLIDPAANNLLLISGQTGNDRSRDGEPVVEGGVGPQTTQVLKNMLAIVKAAGGDASSFIRIQVFLKDCEDRKKSREEFDAAYRAFFAEYGMTPEKGNMRARLQVWVSEVPWEYPTEDTVVEMLGDAAIPKRFFAD